MEYPSRQRGVALVTALLVVALSASVAVAMTARQQVDLRHTENALAANQLRHYLHAVEAWAGEILGEDAGEGGSDHYGEIWAMRMPPVPVENGMIAGHIEDAQGRFNINNLAFGGKSSRNAALDRFRRLLAAVGAERGLADAVVDWIGADPERFPTYGDDYYTRLDPPYRIGNRPLSDASELMLIAGFDADLYRAISPFVVALPWQTEININTALPTVVMSLAEWITPHQAEEFVSGRPDDGYSDPATAVSQLASTDEEENSIYMGGLGVNSNHFMVSSEITYGRLRYRHQSLLQRGEGGTTRAIARKRIYF